MKGRRLYVLRNVWFALLRLCRDGWIGDEEFERIVGVRKKTKGKRRRTGRALYPVTEELIGLS